MARRRCKLFFSVLLLMIISGSLTISTLHSHHHLQWDHPEEFADTGSCLTDDETVCPICGYLLKINLPSASENGTTLFASENFTPDAVAAPSSLFEIVIKGRSPPAVC